MILKILGFTLFCLWVTMILVMSPAFEFETAKAVMGWALPAFGIIACVTAGVVIFGKDVF
jgi:hypothetical protein